MTGLKERAKQWALDREREAQAKESRFGKKPVEQKPIKKTAPVKTTVKSMDNKS
jgi:hypothetical protein